MRVKETLAELGVVPRKSRGQNFLLDRRCSERIVDFSGIDASSAVLEVGPGLGGLTQSILKVTKELCVVEIEERFCSFLRERFFSEQPGRVFCHDICSFEPVHAASALGRTRISLLGNVPYSISSPLVLWIIANRRFFDSATLLMQYDFAERIAAQPGQRSGGSLSILRALYADACLGPRIPGSAFHPPAGVDSVVLRLALHDEPRVPVPGEERFSQVVRAAFSKRRKTLLNSLSAAGYGQDKARLGALLEQAGISPQRRAETLSLEEFSKLSLMLAEPDRP